MQIPLQRGGVHDDDDTGGGVEEDVIAGDFLVHRGGAERVGTWQVHQAIARALIAVEALGAGDSFARPVPGVLSQPGEGVEDRALPRVRIAGKGHVQEEGVARVLTAAGHYASSSWPASRATQTERA